MSAPNPYLVATTPELQGSYSYVTFEELINNFMSQYVGDHKVLNNVTRTNVIYAMKFALKQFNFNVLREIKAVELELGDTLDVVLPNDFVALVRLSWVNKVTGEFMPLSRNENTDPFVHGYLQDNDCEILFDNEGYPLEGTSYTQLINDGLKAERYTIACNCLISGVNCGCGRYYGPNSDSNLGWNLDVTKNYNGTFNIDARVGKIHFSSDNLSRAIVLEYISDGLEYGNTSDIKVNKLAEEALLAKAYADLLRKERGVQDWEKRSAERSAQAYTRNAKIAIGVRIQDIAQMIRGRNIFNTATEKINPFEDVNNNQTYVPPVILTQIFEEQFENQFE